MPSKVMPCTCKHQSQDQLYGDGMRLWNSKKPKSESNAAYKRTVCGAEKEMSKGK